MTSYMATAVYIYKKEDTNKKKLEAIVILLHEFTEVEGISML